jgi:hypothetical protein
VYRRRAKKGRPHTPTVTREGYESAFLDDE